MIDFHVHQPSRDAYGPLEFVAGMDELGVDVSVVFTYDGCSGRRPRPTTRSPASSRRRRSAWSRSRPSIRAIRAPALRSSAASGSTACAASSSIPGCRGSRLTSPGCRTSARRRPSSGCRSSSTTARRRSRRRCNWRRWRGDIRERRCAGPRRATRSLARGDRGCCHDRNVHLCMCATPGYAMRAIVARCPLERLLFGTDAGSAPRACAALRQAAHPPARRARPRRGRTRGDPRGQPAPAARRMIDIHSHVPTHRDRVPEDELVVNSASGAPTAR